jgi:DNA-binding NtrC family response regulator
VKNRILIVDDEKSIRFALTHYFRNIGFEIDQAEDGLQARALVASHEYGMAIVDIHLGGPDPEDGLDLAAFIRQYAPDTAVVVLTGLETPEALRRAAKAGVRSFLRKPAPLALVADIAFDVFRKDETVVAVVPVQA